MRVTTDVMIDRLVSNLAGHRTELDRLRQQVSTGKRITRPSDDPVAMLQSLHLNNRLSETARYRANADDGASWLEVTEAAFRSACDVLHRGRELAVYGANTTLPTQSLDALICEVEELIGHLVDIGNTSDGRRYIFGGHQTQTRPFTLNSVPGPSVVYNGDAGDIERQIGPGVDVKVNTNGTALMPAFNALIQLHGHLAAGDVGAVSTDIDTFDAALDDMLKVAAESGSRAVRLQMAGERLGEIEISLTSLNSQVEDVDLARAVLDLRNREYTYQLALRSGADIVQPTLLDFLK